MTERLVKLTITDDGVAQVTLDRPARRNALTRELLSQLSATVAEAAANPATRLLVLEGSGPAFCAGMDLDEMQQRAAAPDARAQWDQDAAAFRDALVAILKVDMPTLAVVHGPAIAGGFGIVLACDLVLATPAAKFALPEVKRGISPAVVSPLLLYRIGHGPAMPLLLEGGTINGDEAYRLGLCHYLAPAEQLAERRRKLVAALLGGAAGAGRYQAARPQLRPRFTHPTTRSGSQGFGRGPRFERSPRRPDRLPREARAQMGPAARTRLS